MAARPAIDAWDRSKAPDTITSVWPIAMIEVTEICRRIVVRLKGERKIGETVYMTTKKITRARNTPDSR